MLQTVAFWVLSPLAVVSGYLVFRVDSMARATFLLLGSFLAVAGDLVLLDLDYLGALTVLMMTVEMAIMAVFMIMFMMNPAGLMPMSMVHNPKGAAWIALVTFAVLAAGVFLVPWPRRSGEPPPDATAQLGESIMGERMLVMMVIGVALVATMIASLLLATSRGRYDRYGDDLDRDRPVDPVPGRAAR